MNHLIVASHPAERSFTLSLAHAYAGELTELGHTIYMRDLYRMDFSPVLLADELKPGHMLEEQVLTAQADLRSADVLTLFYPLWWLSMPAMMKGYIDRVFASGFAYESLPDGVHGLMGGKKCILVTMSAAPQSRFIENGRWGALETLQDTHIFRSSGFEVVEHVHFDKIMPNLPADEAKGHFARIRDCARRHFSD